MFRQSHFSSMFSTPIEVEPPTPGKKKEKNTPPLERADRSKLL
uniref:PilS cassette n=1 Tax=Heterorhabditis bacteriophora TaxID=37862 RepID=A0A1I7WNI4_HETBA